MTELPPRATRRRDVVLLYASYPLGVLLLHLTLGGTIWYGIVHVLFIVAVCGWGALVRVGGMGRSIADDLDGRLDERQLAMRNAAYLDAYRIVSTVAVLGCVWIALGIDLGWWWVPTTYREWNDIFWGLFLLTMSLPSAFLVWREPDRAEEALLVMADA
ncbi:MAG: hypothetical protein IPJ78_00575 [Gemmatimonadetes bacterium]|nr:hypothetical protein [Gemmatimonadota bacterium]